MSYSLHLKPQMAYESFTPPPSLPPSARKWIAIQTAADGQDLDGGQSVNVLLAAV